jgi:hypothetical protein
MKRGKRCLLFCNCEPSQWVGRGQWSVDHFAEMGDTGTQRAHLSGTTESQVRSGNLARWRSRIDVTRAPKKPPRNPRVCYICREGAPLPASKAPLWSALVPWCVGNLRGDRVDGDAARCPLTLSSPKTHRKRVLSRTDNCTRTRRRHIPLALPALSSHCKTALRPY